MFLFRFLAVVSSILLFQSLTFGQSIKTLTEDGAWCWFSDPRAIYTKGNTPQVLAGWVSKDGSIVSASLNLQTEQIQTKVLYPRLEVDDHDNPAFLQLPDQRILSMYTLHGGRKDYKGVLQNTTTIGTDIGSFEDPILFKPRTEALVEEYQRETYTYANPMMLSKEGNKIYCFGRWIGYKPNMITSTDAGKTWSDPKVVITSKKMDINNRPYVKYFSDGKSKIHLIFTDGHPAVEPLNSVYYCYYENQAFWRADGSKICNIDALPFHPEDASVIYKATPETGKAWIFDVVTDAKQQPVVAYTRYPNDTTHQYYYARYARGEWQHAQIIMAGKWFPQDIPGKRQRELNYSGGLTIDPVNPSVVYFSHQIDKRFEISKGETKDGGKSWMITPITRGSTLDNVRPLVPRYRSKKDPLVLMWMENRTYIHFTEYDTRIKYKIMR
jgi:hypothetical protein